MTQSLSSFPFCRAPFARLSTFLSVCCGLLLSALTGCTSVQSFSGPTSPSTTQTTGQVIVTALQPQLRIGQTETLTATQGGIAVEGGIWSVEGGVSNGSISSLGTYQPPASMPASSAVTIDFTFKSATYTCVLTLLSSAPTLFSATPSSLTQLATAVGFVGTGFVPGTVLTVNGQSIPISYVNADTFQATITVPAGSTQPISVAAVNPGSGAETSNALVIPVNLPSFTVTPAILNGGPVALTLSGLNITTITPVVTLDGKEFPTSVIWPSTLSATVYLPPWKTGSSVVGVEPAAGTAATMQVTLPIAATTVSYDTASRFATQAAFGPRHDVIEHIQQVGPAAFVDEQLQAPPIAYDETAPCCGPRLTWLQNATYGNSLLRARVSWALQSFVVEEGLYLLPTLIPWQHRMEVDAFGNFEQVLYDAASDTGMSLLLNLNGNAASSDPNVHPNQNFARELMQLFSLGDVMLNDDGSVQLDALGNPLPSYDQTTVLNLSRVFTGWNIDHTPDPYENPFGYNYALPLIPTESQHDEGAKVLFGTVILPAGQDAATDRAAAIDAIFQHPNVPPYVSRILIQRLVTSNPSPAYIRRISGVFENDGTGIRGNLAAVVKAILLDPEAREGDMNPSANDGFLQEPLLFQLFGMNLLGMVRTDGEPTYVPGLLGEDYDYATTVFGFYAPTDTIPGTTVLSPEFSLLNNLSLIQRSQVWWSMIQGSANGFERLPNYLYSTFTNVPDMVDALNHMMYHGQMPEAEKTAIINYCATMDPTDITAQLDIAVFLAGNGDSYNVSQ